MGGPRVGRRLIYREGLPRAVATAMQAETYSKGVWVQNQVSDWIVRMSESKTSLKFLTWSSESRDTGLEST